MELKAGDIFGGYTIIRSLGAGAFADVYLAGGLPPDNHEVALKIIREDSGEAMEERGASLMRKVDHPNIVKVFFVGRIERRLTVVMEYVGGKTLRQILQKDRLLPEDRALAITAQIVEAISYLHAQRISEKQGVAHLDLKPSNILVEPDDHTRITDFSTARLGVTGATTSGCGSPAYMAPEQFKGHPVFASDVWAVGVILYEMILGKPLFRGKSVEEYRCAVTGEPDRWLDRLGALPARSRAIVRRCVVREPSDRFLSARELGEAIRAVLERTESRICPECGAALPEDGFCPECTGRAPRRFRPDGTETGPRASEAAAFGLGAFSGDAETEDPEGAGEVPEWATRSISTRPVEPRDRFPLPASSAGATPPRRPGRASPSRRFWAVVGLLLVLGGVATSLWFILPLGAPSPTPSHPVANRVSPALEPAPVSAGPATQNDLSGGGKTGPEKPVAKRPPSGLPPLPTQGATRSSRQPRVGEVVGVPAAESREPTSRPPGNIPAAVTAGHSTEMGETPAAEADFFGEDEPAEDCQSRLVQIQALDKTPAGTYDDRIALLEDFLKGCAQSGGRSAADALLRVWKWEKNAFQAACDVDQGKQTKICEALEGWRQFIQTARTNFRKSYAEERLNHWMDRLRRYEGGVVIRVVRASNLPVRAVLGGRPASPNPYFVVLVDDRPAYRSRTLIQNNAPVWDEAAPITVSSVSRVTLEVWDHALGTNGRLLRFKVFPLPEDGPYSVRAAGATVDLIIERDQ